MIGKRIHEEELKDTRKENYGLEIIKTLSKKLTAKYGKGFSYRNLYSFLDFFKCYPNILQTSSAQSFLSWSHYQVLLQIDDQDVGQMDMYVQMYDEMEKQEDDNPTIGILLCSDSDDCVARYSRLHSNNQLFAAKYKTYLPTEQELKAEIERQRVFFQLQYEKCK